MFGYVMIAGLMNTRRLCLAEGSGPGEQQERQSMLKMYHNLKLACPSTGWRIPGDFRLHITERTYEPAIRSRVTISQYLGTF